MKEKIKTILIIVVTVTLSITGSVVANTILSADSVSYKTENGETTVDNALNTLFNIADLNIRYNDETDYIQIYSNNEWVNWRKTNLQFDGVLYKEGIFNTAYWDGTVSITKSTSPYTAVTTYTNGNPLKFVTTTNNWMQGQYGYYKFTTPIDVSNWDSLHVNISSFSLSDSKNTNASIALLDENGIELKKSSISSVGEIVIDVSEYTIPVYLQVRENQPTGYDENSRTITVSINKIWLE